MLVRLTTLLEAVAVTRCPFKQEATADAADDADALVGKLK